MTRPKKTEHFCSFDNTIYYYYLDERKKTNCKIVTAQVERTRVFVSGYTTTSYKSVVLATTPLKTVFPSVFFFI